MSDSVSINVDEKSQDLPQDEPHNGPIGMMEISPDKTINIDKKSQG